MLREGEGKDRVGVAVATGREGGMLQGEDGWRERDKKGGDG